MAILSQTLSSSTAAAIRIMYMIPALFIMLLLTVFFFIAYELFAIFVPKTTHNHNRNHSSPGSIAALLKPTSGCRSKLGELLQSRALANERLRCTFQLTNTFVSADPTIHSTFVRQMNALISKRRGGGHSTSDHQEWLDFLQVARGAVASQLNSPQSSTAASKSCASCGDSGRSCGEAFNSPFAEFIQLLTLKVIIAGLLDPDRDMDSIDGEDLRVSAKLITELWGKSKTPPPPSTTSSLDEAYFPSDLKVLKYHLRRLLPNEESYPNPIDFVIPTWETLWRLVATSLAHVHENEEYRQVFESLLEEPSYRQYRGLGLGDDSRTTESDAYPLIPESPMCAEWIINETLRLHPPSRHISRGFLGESDEANRTPFLRVLTAFAAKVIPRSIVQWVRHTNVSERSSASASSHLRLTVTEVADIESVHLSTQIWGADARMFNPRRWAVRAEGKVALTTTNDESGKTEPPVFFTFGHGRLACIGEKWAPMAAATIIAAVLEGIKVDGLEIVGTSHIGGRTGWDGWMIHPRGQPSPEILKDARI
ncbi:hypothetical protein D9757_012214 [Collybiopsis confluens]|uniref:Cytochrome P450 n=1 Tax=Collybiopsis confluens TaxID=2823264 RepID=A0A8H5GLG8_9AGAR|nr:hypothetical protein D9757_012214 [Collybiopsis confluens]